MGDFAEKSAENNAAKHARRQTNSRRIAGFAIRWLCDWISSFLSFGLPALDRTFWRDQRGAVSFFSIRLSNKGSSLRYGI